MRLRLTCSALTTSIMTPPFNICARPALILKFVEPGLPWSFEVEPFAVGESLSMIVVLGGLEEAEEI